VDPSQIDALRRDGLSYAEIGARLGTTKDAARGTHTRWLARRARAEGGDPATVRAGTGGDPAGDRLEGAPLPPAGPAGADRGRRAVALKSEIDLARAAITKATRAEVRLKHSILADEEINTLLAARLRAFDAAIQTGVIPSVEMLMVIE
jgi:hypothetical protein